MAYDDEVAPLEGVLLTLIQDANRRGNAIDKGAHQGISIDDTTTKTELTVSHNAILAAFTAYDSASTIWVDALT